MDIGIPNSNLFDIPEMGICRRNLLQLPIFEFYLPKGSIVSYVFPRFSIDKLTYGTGNDNITFFDPTSPCYHIVAHVYIWIPFVYFESK